MPQFQSTTPFKVARLIYILLCVCAGIGIAYHISGPDKLWVGSAIGLGVAGFFIFIELLTKNYTIRGFSTGTFGLLVGLFCAWLFTRLDIPLLLTTVFQDSIDNRENFILTFNTILFSSLGFLGTVIALRSGQDDFAVVIPYVRFRQESSSAQPLLIDQKVITDGRLPQLMLSGFLAKSVIIPKFILDEIQILASSNNAAKRLSGQRGLDALDELHGQDGLKITVHDTNSFDANDSYDNILIQTSQLLNAKILTLDDNLTKVARLQNIDILNINDINDALKANVDIGTTTKIAIVRTGKEEHQGVGYLRDGTMIVVNNGVSQIGSSQTVTIISSINTTGGIMYFAEIENAEKDTK